jgi:hypothetical protein
MVVSWLPHGMFLNKKSKFGYILEGLAIKYVDTFYGHLVYFTAIWYILRPFGIFGCHLLFLVAIWFVWLPFGLFGCHLV